jgi:integrase
VFQRKDGRWVAEITLEDGKRKPLYGKTQEEAIAKLKQAEHEKRQGILATGPKQKLGEYLIYWLDEVHKRHLRLSSYQRYKIARDRHLLPHLGQIQLQSLTTRRIQQFFNVKADEGQSPSSLQVMQKVLHGALEQAVKERLIGVNPCKGVSLPPKKKRKPQSLTVEQARHLLEKAQGSMWEPFLALALVIGMRHGELLTLRWDDLNFEVGSLHIQRTLTQGEKYQWVIGEEPKTETSDRLVLLPGPICEMLKAHRVRQHEARLKAGPKWHDQQLVFCSRSGGILFPTNVRNRFYRLLESVGLPRMHIHDLRHSASTLLRSMGVDLKVIQEILGHKDLDITANTYSHVLPQMQKEALEKMNRLFEQDT